MPTANPNTSTGNSTAQGTNATVTQSGTTADLIQKCDYQIYVTRRPKNLDIDYEDIEFEDGGISNVISIEIRESMDMMFRTATLTISNRSSFRELYPLTGNEVITIVYKNHFHINNSELKRKIIHFQIFNIDEIENQREKAGTPGASYLNIQLVEYPMFQFLSCGGIYKSWPMYTKPEDGKKASECFIEAMRVVPNFERHYELDVEETYEDLKLHNMWIPGWTCQKVIKYFSTFMVNKNNNGYYTFSTSSNTKGKGHKPIASFRSIYSAFDTDHFKTYSTTLSDTTQRQPKSDNDKKMIEKSAEDDVNFSPTSYIISKSISYGNSDKFFRRDIASRTGMLYDYEEGNINLVQTYRNFMKDYKSLGMTMPYSEDEKIGCNQWDNYSSYPFNNKEMLRSYMNNCIAQSAFKQMFMKAMCPVDETRKLGEKAAIFLPSTSKDRMIDFQMSGRWVVWKIVDVITSSGVSTSEVTFVRDSFWIQNGNYLENSKNVYEDEISTFKQRS